MLSHQTAIEDSQTDSRSASSRAMKDRIRSDLADRFVRPPSLGLSVDSLGDLEGFIDTSELAMVAAQVSSGNIVAFTIISREYLQTGLNWIYAMYSAGLTNFLVVAGDKDTALKLRHYRISFVRANVDESGFDPSYVSSVGFSAKGLAMISLKFPVAKFLLKLGYSVIFSDADAIWLQDPAVYLKDTDIAFQRVVYHPASIASLWGFTACTGFLFFRHDEQTINFVDRCIAEHQIFRCDQVAMNVALLEGDPDWKCENLEWKSPSGDVAYNRSHLELEFYGSARYSIRGTLQQRGVRLLALPHDTFWRHSWVSGSLQDMVICHPNSPKNDDEKMKIFDAMGLRLKPTGPLADMLDHGPFEKE